MPDSRDRGPRPVEPGRAGSTSDAQDRRSSRAFQGTVTEALPNAMFSVALGDGRRVMVHVASALQTRTVRILPGDQVTVELSPYDPSRGRITERHR